MENNERSPRASWTRVIAYYDHLRRKRGWEALGPFRTVVAAIADSEYADGLYATNSHQNLIISPYEEYADRISNPLVVLVPSFPAGRVEVSEHSGNADGAVTTQVCALNEAWNCVEPILQRLCKQGEGPAH